MNKMTIEEIATQVMAGILSNPKVLDVYERETMVDDIVNESITYAKELKRHLGENIDVVDVEFEIITD